MDASAEFAEFYGATCQRVMKSVAFVAMNPTLAEDAVAEAYARAFSRWNRLRSYADPAAWVQLVAVNLVISSRRERLRVWRWRRDLAAASVAPAADAAADGPLAAAQLVQLTPRQRAVITLHYVQDMSVLDVAAALGVAEGTVKSDLSRARSRLAATLEERR